MIRRLLITALALSFASPHLSHAANAKDFRGLEIPPLPQGCETVVRRAVDARRGIVLQWVRCGERNFELLSAYFRREGETTFARVRGVHTHRAIPEGYRLTGEDECVDDEEDDDPWLFAIVRSEDPSAGKYASKVLYAWRINQKRDQFIRVDPKRVKCKIPK